MQKLDGSTFIVPNFKNNPFKIISGLVGNRDSLALAFNIEKRQLTNYIIKARKEISKPKEVDDAPFFENVSQNVNLHILPIQKFFEKDGGPYITSAIVIAKDPELESQNISYHRLMLLDEKHFAIRLVPRHLYAIFNKNKQLKRDTPIEIIIGAHPSVLIAASYPLSYGIDELWLANSLSKNNLSVVYLDSTDLLVPAHSEIVLEGKIKHDQVVPEGPFVDITGTYDIVREQPIVEIEKIYHRNNPYFYTILPAGSEHRLLMGMPKEVKIYEAIKEIIPDVRFVNMTTGGCGWLHAVISIKKQTEGDPKNAILAAFAAHPSLKHCVIVDEDIDPYNLNEVEWAIATRFNGEEDLVIVKNVRGSSLDPSADQKTLLTTKIGIDATIPLTKKREDFLKAKVELDVDLSDWTN